MTTENKLTTLQIRYCKVCGGKPDFQCRIVDKVWGGPKIWFARCGNKGCQNHLRVNVISAGSARRIVDKWNDKHGNPEEEPREILVEVEA